MLQTIPFVIFGALGVLILMHRERVRRALQASSRGFGTELGGPFAWWNASPEGSRRARFQESWNKVFIVVFGLVWIGISIYGIVRAVS